jgi:hypothetical protein
MTAPSDTANRSGNARSCTAGADAAPPPPPEAADGGAPTWSQLYASYLWDCAGAGCHVEMVTANGAYTWLKAQGYLAGQSSTLVDPSKSCLKWYGGNMPPCGGGGDRAVSDMNAWAAAGALNN